MAKAMWVWNEKVGLHKIGGRSSNRSVKNKGKHTAEEKAAIRAAQKDRCAYCRVSLNGAGQFDHIEPLARGGSNLARNLQLTCKSCNNRKSAKDPIHFAQTRGLLI